MGGYAAVRAGIALNAHTALAFSPQVLLDTAERRGHCLPEMMFDEVCAHRIIMHGGGWAGGEGWAGLG